ncbi:CvpA family protein [Patescibacteria group bacterium]|nr:CvpA family protein [Patescibacteria group bacterium]
MLIIDIILLIGLLGFVGAGAKDGFIHTLGRLVGAVVGFVIARSWSASVTPLLDLFMPAGIARVLAFIFIFLLITRLVGFVFKLADGAFKILSILPFLKSINALLGGILGFFEGVIISGGIIYLIVTFKLNATLMGWLATSVIAPWIQRTFQILLGVLL